MRSPQGGSVPEAGTAAESDRRRGQQTSKLIREIHLNLLRYLEGHPQVSQRELASHLGVSLGKTNYCLRALVEQGLVTARNFRDSDHKRAYRYLLTPKGVEAKARITARFLRRKMDEYERLKAEIAALEAELTPNDNAPEKNPIND